MKTSSLPILGALAASLALGLPAQEFQPAPGALLTARSSDVQVLWQAFAQSRFGQLLETPAIKPAVDKGKANYEKRDQVLVSLLELAQQLGASDLSDKLLFRTRALQDGEVRDLRFWLYPPADDAENDDPTFLMSLRCGDKESKILAEVWEQATEDLLKEENGYRRADDGPDLGGSKAAIVRLTDDHYGPEAVWHWHKDGLHVLGIGDPAHAGKVGAEAPARTAGDVLLAGDRPAITATLDMKQVVALLQRQMRENGEESDIARSVKIDQAVGIADVASFTLAITVDDGRFRESLHIETPRPAKGFFGAFLDAEAPMPPHPQVEAGMLQVGMAVDLERFAETMAAFRTASARDGEPEAATEAEKLLPDLHQALTGGVSLQISAPSRGSMVPRMSVALGIKDQAALDALLERARKEITGVTFDDRETDGTKWTSIKIPNSPSALVPTFAVVDSVLLLTESPATLRAMLKARTAEGARTAMATDGAPAPTAMGQHLPSLDLRYDLGTIWRTLHERYLPLVQLGIGQALGGGEPILDAGDMPTIDDVVPHLGLGRGGVAAVENGYVLSAASDLGDPFVAATVAIYVPLIPAIMGMSLDTATHDAQGRIGKARLEKVHKALMTWRAGFGGGKGLPRELGELFARGLLDDPDALLIPGDENPGSIEYEDADGEIVKVKSSFRYVPDGKLKTTRDLLRQHMDWSAGMPFTFHFDHDGEEKKDEVTVVLYEPKEHRRKQRLILLDDGKIHVITEDGAGEVLGGR